MVKKGDKETTNIHLIDFKEGIIRWAYKTDEIHEDKLDDVQLFAWVADIGYVKVYNPNYKRIVAKKKEKDEWKF